MKADFQIGPEDYVAFTRYYFTRTRPGRRSQRRLYLLGIALFLLFAGLEFDHPQYGYQASPVQYVLYLGVSAVILGAIYGAFLWYIRPSMARFAVQQGDRKRMLLPSTITLEEDGFTVETADGRAMAAWDRLNGVARTEEHLFLTFPGLSAIIIPVRCFDTGESAAAFYQYAADQYRRHTQEKP